jgi:hypothetical protein
MVRHAGHSKYQTQESIGIDSSVFVVQAGQVTTAVGIGQVPDGSRGPMPPGGELERCGLG